MCACHVNFLQNVGHIWFMVKRLISVFVSIDILIAWHSQAHPRGVLAGVSFGVQEKPGLGEFSFSVCVGQSQHGITHLLGPCVHDVCHRYPTLL